MGDLDLICHFPSHLPFHVEVGTKTTSSVSLVSGLLGKQKVNEDAIITIWFLHANRLHRVHKCLSICLSHVQNLSFELKSFENSGQNGSVNTQSPRAVLLGYLMSEM